MLARARLEPGHRVLEVGTGTGYNAALLAHRLGATSVTSVEIDPALATAARVALKKAGFGAVTVVTGDGTLGHPPSAPYDRGLSTATCHRVPQAWVEQTRPSGRIVTPWASSYHNGALLHLDVSDDGAARGHFGGNVSFMWLRKQRIPFGWLAAQPEATYQYTTTNAHPYRLNEFSASFVIGQHGPRRLWDEATAAYDWWVSAGRPDYHHFGLTVTPDGGQHAWLDSPQHPLPRCHRD